MDEGRTSKKNTSMKLKIGQDWSILDINLVRRIIDRVYSHSSVPSGCIYCI